MFSDILYIQKDNSQNYTSDKQDFSLMPNGKLNPSWLNKGLRALACMDAIRKRLILGQLVVKSGLFFYNIKFLSGRVTLKHKIDEKLSLPDNDLAQKYLF